MNLMNVGWKVAVPALTAAAGAVGMTVKAVAGHVRAGKIEKESTARRDAEQSRFQSLRTEAIAAATAYEWARNQAMRDTQHRWDRWVADHGQSVDKVDFEDAEQLDLLLRTIAVGADAGHISTAEIQGAFCFSTGLPKAVRHAARKYGISSTGTPINQLHGGAAKRALDAFFGGGSLQAGGAGMAGGKVVLLVAKGVPVVLAAGGLLWTQTQRAKKRSQQVVGDIDLLLQGTDELNATHERILGLSAELESLTAEADRSLEDLDRLEFDPDQHADQFTRAAQSVAAIAGMPKVRLRAEHSSGKT